MRITCLITVCAYLSSTVSTNEIQYLNRLRRARSQEKSVLDDAAARKDSNPNTGIRPDILPALRRSRLQEQIETFPKPFHRNAHESQQPSPQQQHPRDRSKRPIKRLKVRSIAGSTYEVDGNEVHEIHEIHEPVPEVHDEGPIYIKPVVRVTKKNIFDSIVDILHQLVSPPKKELGPIVGPIKMPGSKRKIYLRLLEPVDSSHINVRFVTQVPVPIVDEESILSREHESVLPFLPYADPGVALLHRHPVASSDATFSSSNRHQSVQLPRNTSQISGKGRGSQSKPATKLKHPPEDPKDEEKVSPVKVEAASGAESDKNYYQYQTEGDAVRQVTEIIEGATGNEQGAKGSLEPWYQLSTHRLPLRQVSPLYPLSAMGHADSGPYESTYKVPSDSLTVPGQYTSSYEQYGSVDAGAASGFYDQSSYAVPNTYATTQQKQNEFSNAPSSYPISYQNQNEFNNAPSSTSYVKQNDLFSAPTSHASSYAKPASVPPPSGTYATSHEAQNAAQAGSSSQNALRVIDPPLYIPDPRQVPEAHANKVFKHPATQQQPYNLHVPNANEIGSPRDTAQNGERPADQVTWGKVKREKSKSSFPKGEPNFLKDESNFHKSAEITADNNRESWQPLMFVPEDADWHKAFANLAKVAKDKNQDANHHNAIARQQSTSRPRQLSRNTTPESAIESGRVDQRQGGKRRHLSVASTRNSRCPPSDKGNRCEQTEPTVVSTPRPEGKIAKGQTQSAANLEPIVIAPKPVASNAVEMSRSNVTAESSWIEEPQALVMTTEALATSSTTERPSLVIKVMKTTTEKSIENKTTSEPTTSSATEKSAASSTTERWSTSGTSKAPVPRNNTTKRLQLPKRPMIMKKPTFVLKSMQPAGTTKRTVVSSTTRKPTAHSTTEKTKTTRRSKFQGAISKMKSSTT